MRWPFKRRYSYLFLQFIGFVEISLNPVEISSGWLDVSGFCRLQGAEDDSLVQGDFYSWLHHLE